MKQGPARLPVFSINKHLREISRSLQSFFRKTKGKTLSQVKTRRNFYREIDHRLADALKPAGNLWLRFIIFKNWTIVLFQILFKLAGEAAKNMMQKALKDVWKQKEKPTLPLYLFKKWYITPHTCANGARQQMAARNVPHPENPHIVSCLLFC